MPAKCQACVAGIGTLPNGVGAQGDPFGGCSNCDAFACGYHGHRDSNVPEFMCVECDPNLLAASAAVQAGAIIGGTGSTPHDPAVQSILASYRGHTRPVDLWLVRSPAEFLARRPGYGHQLEEALVRRERDPGFTAWPRLPEHARRLLLLARLIEEMLRVPEHRVPPFLR